MTLFTVGRLSPVVISGAVVGRVVEVWDHPNADRLWCCVVDIGDRKLRIVFGGTHRTQPGDLVAVAPPGARLSTGKRMRRRRCRRACSAPPPNWAGLPVDRTRWQYSTMGHQDTRWMSR
jgi:hypothetical protein